MLDPLRAERARTTTEAMHLVALRDKKFRKIRPILARHARNQSTSLHIRFST
jgi:hypothetical protein